MKTEEEIRIMYEWLENDRANLDRKYAIEVKEPDTMPAPGYVFQANQAIEILKWVLDK